MVLLLELILAQGNDGQLRSRQEDQFRTQGEAVLKRSGVGSRDMGGCAWVFSSVSEASR